MAVARPVWGINHVLAYGQSLSTGWEGWPALSRPRHDSLMLGRSVRPRDESAPDFIPVGDAGLRKLAATVQRVSDGALLRPEEVAALPQGDVAMGETVLEGALAFWRGRMLREGARLGIHPLLGSACGVGGRTLERLMRGAQPELFNRLRACMRLGRDAAAGSGRSYGVAAIMLLQGEHNNWGIDGAASGEAEYGALLRALYADIAAMARDISGQADPPALFLYQTGGAYAADAMGVPMAQLRTALHTPGITLAAPVYPVTDKGGHLDANGYRWLGAQFGKVMHQVIDRGIAWRPLHPIAAALDGRMIEIRFHVPVAPLRFGAPYLGRTAFLAPDQGFAVFDDDGEIILDAVAMSGPDRVSLSLGRTPGPGLFVRYAGQTRHRGLGCLHDSDATRADDCYEYDATKGHAPEADIPELKGRPYPLMNWCVAFRMDVPGAM